MIHLTAGFIELLWGVRCFLCYEGYKIIKQTYLKEAHLKLWGDTLWILASSSTMPPFSQLLGDTKTINIINRIHDPLHS